IHRTSARPTIAIGAAKFPAIERGVKHGVEEVVLDRQPAALELSRGGSDSPAAVEEEPRGVGAARLNLETEWDRHAVGKNGCVPTPADALCPGRADDSEK